MKLIILLLTCISSLTLYSQTVEVFGGANTNRFFGKNDDSYSSFTADYHSGSGFTGGIAIDSIRIFGLRMRVGVQFDKYSGHFSAAGNSGPNNNNETIAEIDKSVISLNAFPLNFYIKKRVELNFGAEASGLLYENVSGSNIYSISDWEGAYIDLSEERYSSRFGYGLKGRIAYQLSFFKKIYLIPQYTYYYGLSSEFAHFPEITRSMRHTICIGLKGR